MEITSTPSVNIPLRARRSNDFRGIEIDATPEDYEYTPEDKRIYAELLSSAADWTRLAHARVGVGEY